MTEKKQPPKARYKCRRCMGDFWGSKTAPKCPQCGVEELEAFIALTSDGRPMTQTKDAIGGVDLPPNINLLDSDSQKAMDNAEKASIDSWEKELNREMRNTFLEDEKARATEAKVKRLKHESELEKLGGGNVQEEANIAPQPQYNPFAASMIISSLASTKEDKEWLLKKIEENPQLAHSLALISNPPQYSGQMPYPYPYGAPNPFMFNMSGTGNQSEKEEKSSIAEMAEAISSIMKTSKDLVPSEPTGADKEAINELKGKIDDLKDNYYKLQLALTEMEKKPAAKPTLTEERIKTIVGEEIKNSQKDTTAILQEVKSEVDAIDNLKKSFETEDTPKTESFEEWRKKEEIRKKNKDEELMKEATIKNTERESARYDAVKSLLQAGVIEAHNRRKGKKEGEEKIEQKEEKKTGIFDDVVKNLSGASKSSEETPKAEEEKKTEEENKIEEIELL